MVTRREGWGMGDMGERDEKVQTSTYNINKSWEYSIQHADYR